MKIVTAIPKVDLLYLSVVILVWLNIHHFNNTVQ